MPQFFCVYSNYESAGVNLFFLTGTVINVNRAPEVISPVNVREDFQGEEYDEINLAGISVDTDGYELTYILKRSNDTAVDIYFTVLTSESLSIV